MIQDGPELSYFDIYNLTIGTHGSFREVLQYSEVWTLILSNPVTIQYTNIYQME